MSVKRYDLVAGSEGRALDGKWVRYDDHVAEVVRLRAELSKARTSAAMWERAHDILDESIDRSREHAQVEAVKREAFIERLAAAVERHNEVLAENARLTRERDDARKGWNEVLLEVERLSADLAAARAQVDAHRDALGACADSREEQRQELVKARAERDGLAKAARDLVASWDWWQVDPYDREGPDLSYLRAALAALPKEADDAA